MGRVIYIIGVLLLLFSCSNPGAEKAISPTPYLNVSDVWVDSVLSEMSLEDKLGQMILIQASPQTQEQQDSLLNLIEAIQPSGLLLENIPLKAFINLTEKSKSLSKKSPFIATREQVLLNNQFSNLERLPSLNSVKAIHSDSLNNRLLHLYLQQAKALGINLVFGPEAEAFSRAKNLADPNAFSTQQLTMLERIARFNDAGILSFATGFSDFDLLKADSLTLKDDRFIPYKDMVYGGIGGFEIAPKLYGRDSLEWLDANYLNLYFQKSMHFDGLKVGILDSTAILYQQLHAGVDLILVKDNPLKIQHQLYDALAEGRLDKAEIDLKVRKILKAKYWQNQLQPKTEISQQTEKVMVIQASLEENPEPEPEPSAEETAEEKILDHFQSPLWEGVAKTMFEDALILASNRNDLLPFTYTYKRPFRLIHYGEKPLVKFKSTFARYANFFSENEIVQPEDALPALKKHRSNRWTHIITLDNFNLREEKDSAFIKSVLDLAATEKLVLINFGEEENLRFFDTTLTVIQIFDRDRMTESLAAQLLFGGVQARGKLPYTINEFFKEGTGINTEVIRLRFGLPEEVGISPEKLVSIDAIAKTAIDNRVMPGCQVLVAKNGNVVYSKSFGHHTYRENARVKRTDLYDIASITKVAATTLATMKLYEEKKISLKDRVRDHLDCGKASTIKNIPVKKLLNHSSGLPPSMPIAPYLLYRDQYNVGCDSFFCKENTGLYTVPVAENFYLAENQIDSIWKKVYKTNYRGPRRYRYSDVNFMLMQRIIEQHLDGGMDKFLAQTFYHPLGLRRNLFKPLEAYSKKEIIPTQNDKRWRQQQVHGFVHDEAAALLGGVGGNAGLFSTAEELAVIFQMLLNGGHYGGKSFLEENTIKLFTNTYHGNHRGLGFDKPTPGSRSAYSKSASPLTFGHTGFTGTCVWADPKHDLIFIFLSNRIYPDVSNRALFKEHIRERIHEVVYDALDSYKITFPVLDYKPSQKI